MMKKMIFALLSVLTLMTALPCAMAQDGMAPPPRVKINLIAEHNTVVPGDILWVMFQEEIEPGWHTYWLNPGDSGAAPRIKWTMPEGFNAGDMVWPAPHKIALEGLVSYGYEGNVNLGQIIEVPTTLPDGPLTLTADVEILVCKDICIPETSTHTITLNDPSVKDVDNETVFDSFVNSLPRKSDWTGRYAANDRDFIVHLQAGSSTDLDGTEIDSFVILPTEWGLVKNAATAQTIRIEKNLITLKQERDTRDLSNVGEIPVIISFNRQGERQDRYVTLHPLHNTAEAGMDMPAAQTNQSLPYALLLALLGGLILNLMPCVFPVLSIKVLSLIKLREKGWGASASSGAAYTAGVLLSFAAIGGLLLIIKIAGGDIGWGFQLQNPAIVMGLAYLLFVIGLNLSGIFEIGGSFMGLGSSLTQKHGLLGTFFTGVLATVVATPCTAPFMAGALGYALTQPPATAMAVFMALGLGLSLPYLVLSLVPALAAFLPRPGPWMVTFRKVLAFPLYASAIWLLWVLSIQAGLFGLVWAIAGMVAIALALWLQNRRALSGLIVAVAFLFAVIPIVYQAPLQHSPAPQKILTPGTESYTPDRLGSVLAGDDPVFVYMTAAWCITCKVNERVAIHTDSVQSLFKKHNVAVLEGDWTNMNPDITKFLKTYGRSGVPLYVFYGAPDQATGKRPEPVILPQLLTPGLMKDIIGE